MRAGWVSPHTCHGLAVESELRSLLESHLFHGHIYGQYYESHNICF